MGYNSGFKGLTQQFAGSQTTIWVPCKNCLQLPVWWRTLMNYRHRARKF